MIRYDRLWETMKRKKISQYRLMKKYGFSSGQLSRLKKNMYVSTHTIEVLCSILECPVEDVIEWEPEVDYTECLTQLSSETEENS
ncbi:MAG: helix-turn-helix transcriptional regulator [bacterium]|nr:helix-turn-helix transcriptional regulator [bacterium]